MTVTVPSDGSTGRKIFIGILVVAFIAGVISLIVFLSKIYNTSKETLPTAANNARIAAEQIALLDPIYVNKGNLPAAPIFLLRRRRLSITICSAAGWPVTLDH